MNQQKESDLLKKRKIFKNETFQDAIFEKDIDLAGNLIFDNCIFKERLSLKRIKANLVSFKKCRFENELDITDCTFSEFSISNSTFSDNLVSLSNFCNSNFTLDNISGQFIEIGGWYKELVLITVKLDQLRLKDVNADYSPIETIIEFKKENAIEKISVESISNFSKINFKGGDYNSITFNGTFNNDINFNEKISTEYVFIESSIFKGRLDLHDGKYEHISISRSSFHGLIVINGFDIIDRKANNLAIKEITLHSSHFEKTVSIDLQNIESIDLSDNNFEQLFNFNNHLESALDLSYTFVNLSGSNQGNIIIDSVYADLSLYDINLGNLYFKNIAFHTLYLNEFINKGNVSFTGIISGIYLTINNSILGNFYLLNEDLNIFEEIVIANSNIEGLKLGVYPKRIRSYSSNPQVGYGIKDKRKNVHNLRNVYNQLKQVAKSSGDIDVMYKYKALELRALVRTKRIGFDSILLILNWISNNNGSSWIRGILFTIIIGFVFFLQYLKTIGVETNFFAIYKDYILFITSFPEMSLEKYVDYNSLWNVSLVIWLSRIFVSYGIYQTISAFRKYGKL